MKKTFCDACGNEGAINNFTYLCHLGEHYPGYADSNGNTISGRPITLDICNKCYNDILEPAIKKLKEIQSSRNAIMQRKAQTGD